MNKEQKAALSELSRLEKLHELWLTLVPFINDELTKIYNDRASITGLLNKDEQRSYNSGFNKGVEVGYLKGHQEASTVQEGATVEDDWVRVEDGLPETTFQYEILETSREVIIYDETYGIKIAWLKRFTADSDVNYVKKGDWLFENLTGTYTEVTHWKPLPNKPGQSPTPTTDKVEEEIKRHSDTWDAAYKSYERNSQVADGVEQDGMYVWTDLEESNIEKDQYLKSLENKLRNS